MSRIRLVRELPLHIPLHPARHGLQAAEHLPGPLELPGLCMPSVLSEAPLHEHAIALPQPDALGFRDPQHGGMDLPVQPRVCRVLDCLRLHRRVHDDLLEAALRDDARGLPRADRGLKQLLHAFLADAAPPACHLRGVDREVVLEELLATEMLPVGVLHPALHHLLIRQPVGVLQKMKARHQSDRNTRTPQVGHIHAAEFRRQVLPGNHRRQPHQLVVRVQRQIQLPADYRLLARRPPRFRLHPYTRKSGVSPHFLVYQICLKFPQIPAKSISGNYSGPTTTITVKTGSEFAGKVMDAWADSRAVQLPFTRNSRRFSQPEKVTLTLYPTPNPPQQKAFDLLCFNPAL